MTRNKMMIKSWISLRSIINWVRWCWVVRVVLAGLAIATIYYLIMVAIPRGYTDPNTGFGEYTQSINGVERGKTLWDWMELLLVPLGLLLTTAIFGFTQESTRRRAEKSALELEAERSRENALQIFLNDIGMLIREDNLGEPLLQQKAPDISGRQVRILALAQAKTNTILTVLKRDEYRSNQAIEFIIRAGLVTGTGISLKGARLRNTYFFDANLSEADLFEADLQDAELGRPKLRGAYLGKSNLKGIRLLGADIYGASMDSANLAGADLWAVNLQNTDLTNSNLEGAVFSMVDLTGALLEGANILDLSLDEECILPDGNKWTPAADMTRFTDRKNLNFWEPPQ